MSINRRLFLQQLGFGTASLYLASGLVSTTEAAVLRTGSLPRSLPQNQGVTASGLLDFVSTVESRNLQLHSMMVVRHGQVVAEGWWAPYAAPLKHTLYSLSKSFTSTAVGMAVAEKKLTVEDKIVSFFPEDVPETISENLAAMRVRDLLTMSTGHAKEPSIREGAGANWVKAFLAHPVEHKPGTHFVYNSGATYVLSALIQKLTGQTLLDYLKPRLFVPLGITGADWEVDPNGINTGGWGLRVRTEDIAKFGQLYLQKGVWNGKQLIPASWVEDATRSHIQSAGGKRKAEENDWLQGYGYQFWRCRHNAYRGDGALGQYCIVLPDQDAVVAITSETSDMQAIMDAVWDHVLPALEGKSLSEGSKKQPQLTQKLKGLKLSQPEGKATEPMAAQVSGKTYQIAENTQQTKSVTLTFAKDSCRFELEDGKGKYSINCGLNRWVEGETTFSVLPLKLVAIPVPGETKAKVAAYGTWQDPNTFVMTWRFIETAHYDTVTCQFDPGEIRVSFKSSLSKINKTPDKRPELKGKLAV